MCMDNFLTTVQQAALYRLYADESLNVRIAPSAMTRPILVLDTRFINVSPDRKSLLIALYERGYCVSVMLKRHHVNMCGCELALDLCADYNGAHCPKSHLRYSSALRRDIAALRSPTK